MKHVLAVWVEHHSGVLTKISGLFSRRGYNIESLVVSKTEDNSIAHMTIVVWGDDRVIEQVKKQLNKLIDVIKVNEITNDETVDRQLLLVRVSANNGNRGEIIQMIDIFRGRIVDIGRKSLIIEATGDETKIQAMINALQPYGIQELVKTGVVAMTRESKNL
ncbi:MAG: acetolactate synthase small subunit [Alkaliphilus sp.]|nr:acetolactate synthase small subunit [Alkaliphilus sp.]